MERPAPSLGFALAAILVVGLLTGCATGNDNKPRPAQVARPGSSDRTDTAAFDPVELQQALLRFADEFSTQMIVAVDSLEQDQKPIPPAEALNWKIVLLAEPCGIVSGSNPLTGLLDLTVFITVMRATMEEHWQPKVFGSSANVMLDYCRQAETAIWGQAGRVLTADQQSELRRAIEAWRGRNPRPESVLGARAQGFTSRLARVESGTSGRSGSVFDLLRLDPLSGLDPATREIAETRLFAERALFVFQKMPTLLRWQAELMGIHALQTPAVQQVVTNSTQIAGSVDRFSRVAEQLPQQLSTEREEILKAFEKQENTLAPIVSDFRGALTAGTQMSTSLNSTITTFDSLMKRFGVGEPKLAGTPEATGEPFRVQDYANTAAQLEQMSLRLTELLRTFDQTLGSPNLTQLAAKMSPVVQQAQASSKDLVDYAFGRGIVLVFIVLVAALLYRLVSTRLTRSTHNKSESP